MMANRSDRVRQRSMNDVSCYRARPFVRPSIRENHQGLRQCRRASRPDTRLQASCSLSLSESLCKAGAVHTHRPEPPHRRSRPHLSLRIGDRAHIDRSGPKARCLIADIEQRCRGAVVWRQLQQSFAPCRLNSDPTVAWRRLRDGSRCRLRGHRHRWRCGGGRWRRCLHAREQQAR